MKKGNPMKRYVLIWIAFLLLGPLQAQYIPVGSPGDGLHAFLEEIATLGQGGLNPAAKPWSGTAIFQALRDMDTVLLDARQRAERRRYLRSLAMEDPEMKDHDYHVIGGLREMYRQRSARPLTADIYSTQSGIFRLRISPILEYETFANASGSAHVRGSGLAFEAYMGKHWGFYGSLSDHYESVRLAEDTYLTMREGANYKLVGDGGEYSRARGGISFAWEWGAVLFAKDHIQWGSGSHGTSIFSGRTPSFPYISLQLKPAPWLEFRYFHGWLVSEVIDSARTLQYVSAYGPDRREFFTGKYIAANLFTIEPLENLRFSFGNSIVYSDEHARAIFFIPFLFYKSADHFLTGAGSSRLGQNAQMFFDISFLQIKHLHAYASLFVDEVSFSRFWDKEEHSNFFGMKGGVALHNWPHRAIHATAEYTRNHPLAYRHNTPVTTFESNRYNLGHYLTDNADEWYLSLRWTPVPGGSVEVGRTLARKGPDYTLLGGSRLGLPFMSEEIWRFRELRIGLRYELVPGIQARAALSFTRSQGEEQTYLPVLFHGDQTTWSLGLSWRR